MERLASEAPRLAGGTAAERFVATGHRVAPSCSRVDRAQRVPPEAMRLLKQPGGHAVGVNPVRGRNASLEGDRVHQATLAPGRVQAAIEL
jgi:hypothetical protein